MSEARQSPRFVPAEPGQQLCSLWQDGQRPDVSQFLSDMGPLTPPQLVAVLRVDQRQRWQSGEKVRAEFYLENYPALKAERESAFEVIYAEFLLREELGESPRLADYQDRFPEYAERLREQIELHQAFGSGFVDKDTSVDSQFEESLRPTLSPAGRRADKPAWPSVPGYEITGELGRGGMGVVYRASQASLKRVVALKMVLAGDFAGEHALIRFRTEAEAAARLHHPNIVQIYEIGEHDGRPYFTMEHIEGATLARLADGKPQAIRQAAELVETLSRAMHYAHQKGIVHRDLKPANILFANDEPSSTDRPSKTGTSLISSETRSSALAFPKITDFGLAKLLVGGSGQTETGAVIGTPSYMAPEQAAGKVREAGPPVDVYALGAILYELLTGRPPFRGASPVETLQQSQSLEPVSPRKLRPKLSRDLETICLKCLDKHPGKRYETAYGLAEDLRRFLAGEPIHAHPAGRTERLVKWTRRRPMLAALVAVSLAAILFAAGGAWLTHRNFQRQSATFAFIDQALEETVRLRDRARASSEDNVLPWTEALEAARRAQAIAGQEYSTPDRDQRIHELTTELEGELRDRQMAERLDEIRLRRADMEGDIFDYERAGAGINYKRTETEYAAAFQAYGISVDGASPEASGRSIRDRKTKDKLMAALDDWIYVRTMLPAAMKKDSDRLVAIAQAADSEPWRNRLRECVARKDLASLKKLAAEANSAGLPASTIVLLGNALANADDAATAVNVLKNAIERHATDFWVNYYLGRCLARKEPPELDEAARYFSAARAIRSKSVVVHYGLGNVLRRKKKWDEAIAEFHEAIRLNKSFALSYRSLGRTLQESGKPDQGITATKEALRLWPDDADAYLNLGIAYQEKKDFPAAIDANRQAIRLKKDFAAAYVNLGNALKGQKKPDEAIAAYRRAIALKKDYALAHYNLATVLRAKGNLDEAIAECREALRSKDDYADAHRSLGSALLNKREYDLAIKEFRRVIELEKDNHVAVNGVGVALDREGLKDQAIDQYRQAIRLKNDFPEPHNNLALALQAKGQFDLAVAEFQEAIRFKKDYVEAHNNLAWLLATCPDDRIRNCKQAVELARKACDLTSHGNAEYLDTLAAAYAETGDFTEAVRWEEKAIALPTFQSKRGDPARARMELYKQKKPFRMKDNRAWTHITLGNAVVDKGNVDEAITEYHKAILLEDNHTEAFNGLGIALRRKGRLDEAIANFERAIQIDKKNYLAHDNLGLALLDKGNLDRALAEFHEAIACKSDYAPGYYGLALAFRQKRDPEDALAACRQAIRLNPNNSAAHNLLGNIFYDQKKFDEAAVAYRAAIALKKNDEMAHRNLGVALRAQGKLDEAMAEYREAIRIKEDYTEAHLSLAGALLNKPNLDEAIKEYRKVVALEKNNPSAINDLGVALYRKGLPDQAIVQYTEAIRLKSDFPEAHDNLGLVLRANGKLKEAIAEYDEAIRLKKNYARAHRHRAQAFLQNKEFGKAASDLDVELRLEPKSALVHNQLAWLLATCPDENVRNGKKAVELARKACDLTSYRNAAYLDTLAAACAQAGDFTEAVRWEEQALALPLFQNKKSDPARARLELYKQKKPFRQK